MATPPGRGGIGIVRISGAHAAVIARALTGRLPEPRRAAFAAFRDAAGAVLDRGLMLYFRAPHSYTGEDVLELHAHGGPVVLDLLLARALALGARPAAPGEYTRRAYLNGKLDLAQAEAVADLIDCASAAGARAAARSLAGEFSARVTTLVQGLAALRAEVEAGLDFPEDDLPPVSPHALDARLESLTAQLEALRCSAAQGRVLREGVRVVLAGAPNVGKSSLLNRLAGHPAAIVTPIPGTTRDVLRETVVLDGLPVQLSDTAGLRTGTDVVEREGVRRAQAEIAAADHVLYVTEAATPAPVPPDLLERPGRSLTRVLNKTDLAGRPAGRTAHAAPAEVRVSALTGAGLPELVARLKEAAGLSDPGSVYGARRRHLEALADAAAALTDARSAQAPELVAEALRAAATALAGITGQDHPEALLSEIFARFCIGK